MHIIPVTNSPDKEDLNNSVLDSILIVPLQIFKVTQKFKIQFLKVAF